jgi:hypothetical protein
MLQFAGRTALITGASKGIGYHLARLCAFEGADLVLVSRNTEDLEHAARTITAEYKVAATILPTDLSDPGSVDELWHKLEEKGVAVDILVNNAGIGAYGAFHEITEARARTMLQLNVVSFAELMRRAAIGMVNRKWGRILNVASVAGFQPMPFMGAYAATKAYVLSLSEAAHVELAPHGVVVTCLAPGPTETDFFASAGMAILRTPGVMKPDAVADIGFRGLLRKKALVVPGSMNKLMLFSGRFITRSFLARAAASVLRQRKPSGS